MISRLAEIEAMNAIQVTMDEFVDLDLEIEALEEAIDRLLGASDHTLH